MTSLVQAQDRRVPARITGSPGVWGRDLGLVGAVSGLTAPLALAGTGVGAAFLLTSAAVGLLCGLLLGLEMPHFLDSARRRMPLSSIALRCTAVGAAIGGFVGLISAQAAGHLFLEPFVVAGIAGALQLGWLWLPYTVLTVVGRPTWPVVLAACALAPWLGPLAAAVSRGLIAVVL